MFYKEIHENKNKILVLFIVFFVVYAFLIISKDQVNELFDNIYYNENSEIIQKFIGNTDNFSEKLKGFEFYNISQWYGKNLGQFIPFLGIIFGFSVFSKEKEKNTISFLITRIKRKTIFIKKYIYNILSGVLLVFIFDLFPLITSFFVNEKFSLNIFGIYTFSHIMVFFFWYSISVFFSVVLSDSIKSFLGSLIVFIITVSLGFLPFLGFLNSYFFMQNPYYMTAFNVLYIAVISLAFVFLSEKIFIKKDY